MTPSDPLVGPLRDLAVAAWPFLRDRWGVGIAPVLSDDAAQSTFDEALGDDSLMALFPTGTEGYVMATTGDGRLISREILAGAIIVSAGAELGLRQGSYTDAELADAAEDLLPRLRRLVAGDAEVFPVLSTFNGVQIAPGTKLELPWGVLSEPNDWLVPATGGNAPDLMLVGNLPISIAVTEPGPDPKPPAEISREWDGIQRQLERQTMLTELALLLGVTTGKPAALWEQQIVIGPLFGYGLSTRGAGKRALFGRQAFVDAEAAGSVTQVAEVLSERHTPVLDLAATRLISSVAARADPGDGLVDAVIALEAMFAGTDQGELSFRISAALGWLLEPDDPAAREKIFKEAREIYDARSKIVHGQAPPSAEANLLRDRAFDLGRNALGRLYRQRPELLADDTRSRRLILGL